MLELDILLREYLIKNAAHLNARQRAQFEKLLECKDQQLHDAFCGKAALPDAASHALLEAIKRDLSPDKPPLARPTPL